jgi:hypothetical protein
MSSNRFQRTSADPLILPISLCKGPKGHIPADGWKTGQEAFEAVAGFQVVEQGAYEDARSSERGSSGQNLGIPYNDRFHICSVSQKHRFILNVGPRMVFQGCECRSLDHRRGSSGTVWRKRSGLAEPGSLRRFAPVFNRLRRCKITRGRAELKNRSAIAADTSTGDRDFRAFAEAADL